MSWLPDMRQAPVLLTGGSGGIGLEVARVLLEAGAPVLLVARRADRLAAAVRELRGAYPHATVHGVVCDVTIPDAVEAALDELEARCGPVKALVHAAGVLGSIGPVVEVDPTAWFEVVRVNLLGTLVAARACARRMAARAQPVSPEGSVATKAAAAELAGHGSEDAPGDLGATVPVHRAGRLVLFSGGGATAPFPAFTAYACSKAGVVRLAETLSEELAPLGIAVNALAPGMVATPMHEATLAAGERSGAAYLERTRVLLRDGGFDVRRAAEAAAFLASDAADGISGRLLAAPWDDWERWPERRAEMVGDVYTLRRVVPRDRGMDWQ